MQPPRCPCCTSPSLSLADRYHACLGFTIAILIGLWSDPDLTRATEGLQTRRWRELVRTIGPGRETRLLRSGPPSEPVKRGLEPSPTASGTESSNPFPSSGASLRTRLFCRLRNLHVHLKKLFQFQFFLCGCRSVPCPK